MTFNAEAQDPAHSPGSVWNAASERFYREWLSARELPLAQRVYPFLILLVLGFGVWDYFLDPKAIFTTWPLRLAVVAVLGAIVLLLNVPTISKIWRELTFVVNLLLFGTLLLILTQIENGPLWGMPGLLLSAVLFRVHSPLLSMLTALGNAALITLVYSVFDVPLHVIVHTHIFVLCASAGNVLLNYCDDQRNRELFVLNAQLEERATTDPLTGAFNRRIFSERMGVEIERAARYGHPLSLVLFQIDNFGELSETRGQGDSDHALQSVAQLGIKELRIADTFGRLGTEIFVILMPHADGKAAFALAQRLCETIESFRICGENGIFTVGASFGVAQFNGVESEGAFLSRTQTALDRARNGGQNRVEAA